MLYKSLLILQIAPITTLDGIKYVECGNKNPTDYSDCSVADLAIDMFCCMLKINGKNQCLLLSKPNRIYFKSKYGDSYICPNSSFFIKISTIILPLFALILA